MSERKPPSGTGQPQDRGDPSVRQEVSDPASPSIKQEAPGPASPSINEETPDPAPSSSSSYNTPTLAYDQLPNSSTMRTSIRLRSNPVLTLAVSQIPPYPWTPDPRAARRGPWSRPEMMCLQSSYDNHQPDASAAAPDNVWRQIANQFNKFHAEIVGENAPRRDLLQVKRHMIRMLSSPTWRHERQIDSITSVWDP